MVILSYRDELSVGPVRFKSKSKPKFRYQVQLHLDYPNPVMKNTM